MEGSIGLLELELRIIGKLRHCKNTRPCCSLQSLVDSKDAGQSSEEDLGVVDDNINVSQDDTEGDRIVEIFLL